MVDAADLNPAEPQGSYEFDSRLGHRNRDVSAHSYKVLKP